MTHSPPSVPRALSRLLQAALVLCLLGLGAARADEYADVLQLLRNGRSTEALTRIDAYITAKPRDPQMRFVKGVVLSENGRANEAQSVFLALTREFPELPEPHNNLAVLYAGQGEFDKARESLEMAVRANPSYAVAHENLGDIYLQLAQRAYGRAAQLNPAAAAALAPRLTSVRELLSQSSRRNTGPAVWPAPPARAASAPR